MAQVTFDISELAERYPTAFTLAERGEEVILTAPGCRPVRLMPLPPPIVGMHAGTAVRAPEFNDPLPDEFWESGPDDPLQWPPGHAPAPADS